MTRGAIQAARPPPRNEWLGAWRFGLTCGIDPSAGVLTPCSQPRSAVVGQYAGIRSFKPAVRSCGHLVPGSLS